MRVKLSGREMVQGALVGVIRQVENVGLGRPDNRGCPPQTGWQAHVEGALAEMALAKHAGLFWAGAHEIGKCDILGYEVRATHHARGRLIVHESDADDSRFVLMTGLNGEYFVRGWILGRAAKREEWWEDPTGSGRAAFFVPQDHLQKVLP